MNGDLRERFADPVPGSPKPDAVLIIDGITRSFGGIHAVDVAHLEIQRHTVTSLIGPNGAGKTTLFNLLSGFDKPDAGEWHLNGGALVGISAHNVARRGNGAHVPAHPIPGAPDGDGEHARGQSEEPR